MIEKISMRKSGQETKEIKRQQIEAGLAEYLAKWRPKEDFDFKLEESFEEMISLEPLKRKEIEKEAEVFVNKNFQELIPMLIWENSFYENKYKPNYGEIIDIFNLTNEQIGLLNEDYYIQRDFKGDIKVFKKGDEYWYDGITSTDLISLIYAKDNIRIDTQNEMNKVGSFISHRYYLKSKNRYLCENDFGMRVWDEDENRMINGDVRDVTPFIKTIKSQFKRIQGNVLFLAEQIEKTIRKQIQSEFPEIKKEDYKDISDYWTDYGKITKKIDQRCEEEMNDKLLYFIDEISKNPDNKKLLVEGVSIYKFHNDIRWKSYNIAKKYRLISDNPDDDYNNYVFGDGNKKIEKIFREPTKDERGESTLDFLISDFHNKPIIIPDDFKVKEEITNIKKNVRNILAYNIVQNNPKIACVFNEHRSTKGGGSPYFYHDYELYDFINDVGIDKINDILISEDTRDTFKEISGYRILKDLGYNFSKFSLQKIKKQLYDASKLYESGIWKYLLKREKKFLGLENESDEKLTNVIKKKQLWDLFYEGKQIYWLALQVHIQGKEEEDDNSKFYNKYHEINWDRYTFSKEKAITKEKINKYFNLNKNLIIALLGQNDTKKYNNYGEEENVPVTLELIIEALEQGQDLRGVAVARDKQRYLKGVINGENKNDLEYALQDWSDKWREIITKEEISLYYEYADDYILKPNGLTKYAEWKTNNIEKWGKLFLEKIDRKSELDFRLGLTGQNDEIIGWYATGAEYVGNKQMQKYLMRFNTLYDSRGQFSSWHDMLFWIPNIEKMEVSEIRAILADIQTMDENKEFIKMIQKYNREKDPFTEKPILSLRELKKRILAIESNIDMSKFPQKLLDITLAPGFNLSALDSFMKKQEFKDLLDGKFDNEQPFRPYKKIFVNTDLSSVLKKALGSWKENVRGTANSPKKLFSQLKNLVKGKNIDDRNMTVADLLKDIPADLEEEIILLLEKQNVDIGQKIEAEVHAKSDPSAWVCGNYTDCCMSFGNSNNTDYMFNSSTQYFTVKVGGRIIAQSVVVDGRNNLNNEDVVILDNIEVANNYMKFTPILSNVYRRFWTEYTSKPVKIGTGYSDLIPSNAVLEENNFSPKTRLEYSDAKGGKIYDLPKINGIESTDEIVTFSNLTEHDVKLISKMETETYPENMRQGEEYILDIFKKQRELEVPGAASSFLIRKGSEIAGYLLVLPEKSEINSDEQVAHIYDMVVLPKFQGTSIIKKMMERVLEGASNYNVSIEAEARASTSYALLMNKRVQKWIKNNGFELTKNEKMPKYLGEEDFYFVRLDNIKK